MLNKKRIKNNSYSKSKSFLLLLYEILNDSFCKEFIHWNSEGTGIIIPNINKFTENLLPKYFKHNNYASFIRQLNIYGFHKMKGIIKNGDEYKNEKFNITIKKKEIHNLIKQKKRQNFYSNYINNINTNDLNNVDKDFSFSERTFFIKYLFEKNEENQNCLIELKNELSELKNQHYNINNQLQQFNNNFKCHNLLFQKLLSLKSENNIKKVEKIEKTNNLKDLFIKYLYHIKIYSPYINFENKNYNNYKQEKVASILFGKIDNTKKDIFNNSLNSIKNIRINNNIFFEELENKNQDLKTFDFNYLNINSSNSLSNFEKSFK